MVDFSDVTDEDIQKQWELLCAREKQSFDAFAKEHPAWEDFPLKPLFETAEAYKQHLYEGIRQYKNGAPLPYDDVHTVMQELYDNLKGHTL